jgi:dUTP pyrophosphatase
VEPGVRVAQLLFMPITGVRLLPTDELDDTHRGDRGFGSSGTGES